MKQGLWGSMTGLLAGLFLAVTTCSAVLAADPAPDALIKTVANEVLEIVRKDKDIQSGHASKTFDLVESKILPHFNFKRMTQLALGREARKATPEQLDIIAGEFRELLVRTYSKALSEFSNHEIIFKPLKLAPAETDAKVRTEIKQSGGKPVAIDYYLEKSATGWKVYDVEVAGVSLVTTYRSSFAQEIQANGVDGLIRSLQAKNKSTPVTKAK